MTYFTLSIAGAPDDAQREAIDAIVLARGGRVTWRANERAGRSYASLELPDGVSVRELPAVPGASLYETAVIALAVSPTVPQALPQVVEAFAGAGRPGGVLACRTFEGGAIVEWDPEQCSAELVLKLVDVELRRFASGRTAQLLSPLPPEVLAKVAAQGLQSPQLGPQRILEVAIDGA